MTPLKYSLVVDPFEDTANITIYHGGRSYVADQSHPCYEQIKAGAESGDESVIDLFDMSMAVGKRLSLSERISVASGRIFLDGDEISDGLTRHILRMLSEGVDTADVRPFVALLENILQNPSQNSREQLYQYIDKYDITITQDGYLVLYKYVNRAGNASHGKAYESVHAGPAIVNGEPHKNGCVPQSIGDVVEMARSHVVDNPYEGCSVGLHVGAWTYVNGYGGNVKLEIRVHPRDVVSVPFDASHAKVRVCRYTIVGEVTEPYSVPVLPPESLVVPLGSVDDLFAEGAPEEPENGSESPTAAIATGTGWPGPEVPLPEFSEPTPASGIATAVKHPTRAEFSDMQDRAKRRKRNFVTYATKMGPWHLLDGQDGSDRVHWAK